MKGYMKMVITIAGTCLGLFFIMFYFILSPGDWKNAKHGKGVVTRYTSDERNNIRFYIRFRDQEKDVEGASIYYKSNGSYHAGSPVDILWFYNRMGDPCIRIEDERLVPAGASGGGFRYVFLTAGIIIIAAAWLRMFFG